jgi:uncharacterized membrane protein
MLIPIIIATILRITMIINRGTYWFDEMFSVHFSSLPWNEALYLWTLETNPPLHTFLLRFWINIFENTEIYTRSFSLIFSIASIALTYKLAQKIFNKKTALASSLLMSVSGIHIFLGTEARTYSLLCFLSVLSFSLFFDIYYKQKNSKQKKIFYIFVQILLLYSHLTAILIPFMQFCILILTKKKSKQYILSHIGVIALFLIWFIPSVLSKLSQSSLNGWFFSSGGKDFANIFTTFTTYIFSTKISSIIETILIVLLFLLFYTIINHIKKQKNNTQSFLIALSIWAIFPAILSNLFGIYLPKYTIIALPAFFILIGFVISQIQNKHIYYSTLFFVTFFIGTTNLPIIFTPVHDATLLTKKIEQQETNTSVIISMPFQETLVLNRYYKGNNKIIPAYPLEDNYSQEERIVRKNWQTIPTTDETIHTMMTKYTKGKDKVFLLQYIKNGKLIKWLEKNNWTHIETTKIGYYAPQYLMIYER